MQAYETRYCKEWPEIAMTARQLSSNLCCYPGCWNQADSVHHIRYQDDKGNSIAGREKPGIDIFPLCEYHHSKKKGCAHHRWNWIKYQGNRGVTCNKNTSQFHQLLISGWIEKRIFANGFPASDSIQ